MSDNKQVWLQHVLQPIPVALTASLTLDMKVVSSCHPRNKIKEQWATAVTLDGVFFWTVVSH